MFLIGWFQRWWHCLLNTHRGHRAVDIYDNYKRFGDGKLRAIGCDCGKTFWVKP